MITYSDELLRSLKEQKLRSITNERFFVKKVRKYLSAPCGEPLVITGLRGTGKTTGVLQAIPDDTCYIQYEEHSDNEGFAPLKRILDKAEHSCYVIDNGDAFRAKEALFSYVALNHCTAHIIILQEEPVNLRYFGKSFGNIIQTSVIDQRESKTLDKECGDYSKYFSSYGFFPGSEITDASLYFEESIVKRVFSYVRDLNFVSNYSLVRESVVRIFESLFSPGYVRFSELDMYAARALAAMNILHFVKSSEKQVYRVFATNPCIYYMYHRIYRIYDRDVDICPQDIFRGIALNYISKYGYVELADDPSIILLKRDLNAYKFFCKTATGFKHMGNIPDLIYIVEPDEEDALDNEYVSIQDLDNYLGRLDEYDQMTEFF